MDHGPWSHMVPCGPWTMGPWTTVHPGPWFHDWVLPRRISCLTGHYYVVAGSRGLWSMVHGPM